MLSADNLLIAFIDILTHRILRIRKSRTFRQLLTVKLYVPIPTNQHDNLSEILMLICFCCVHKLLTIDHH